MARILGIDYGLKRTGLSVTDPLQIIVTGLDYVGTDDLMDYLKEYMSKENVEKIVMGWPTHADGNPTYLAKHIEKFEAQLRKLYPSLTLDRMDESFSSAEAKTILIKSGVSRKKRAIKGNVDKLSAVIILQKYLKHI